MVRLSQDHPESPGHETIGTGADDAQLEKVGLPHQHQRGGQIAMMIATAFLHRRPAAHRRALDEIDEIGIIAPAGSGFVPSLCDR